jgi:hypothetical protein
MRTSRPGNSDLSSLDVKSGDPPSNSLGIRALSSPGRRQRKERSGFGLGSRVSHWILGNLGKSRKRFVEAGRPGAGRERLRAWRGPPEPLRKRTGIEPDHRGSLDAPVLKIEPPCRTVHCMCLQPDSLRVTYVSRPGNRVLTKLGVRDRAQLVVVAYETGLVSPGSP